MDDEQIKAIGHSTRNAIDGNSYVGSFAAELIGESYPLSKGMFDIVFKMYSDLELGNALIKWDDQKHKKVVLNDK